jgi:hypothetical protein
MLQEWKQISSQMKVTVTALEENEKLEIVQNELARDFNGHGRS